MEEDYVSYELAKKLKRLGFDKYCEAYWYKIYTDSDKMGFRRAAREDYNNDDWSCPHCSAPTLWQAWKWLRKVKNINTEVHFDVENREMVNYDWSLFWVSPFELIDNADDSYASYEEALEAGIMRAVEMLLSGELDEEDDE